MLKSYDNSVFVNCPFDDGYKELLYAIVYTIYKCGFSPRSALEEDNALVNRLAKIEDIIEQCKFGIHDLSRTETNKQNLPRFNMPFELGIFFGARRFGGEVQKSKVALILERERYLYQQYISDLNGIDTKAHHNQPEKAIKIVRDWLQSASNSKIDGHVKIITEYKNFIENLMPIIVQHSNLDIKDLTFNDYCLVVEASLAPYMN